MQSNIDTLRAIIASRKSVFPTVYNDRKIERPVMEAVLESANFAPSHRLTQPWKFVVFENDSLKSLGDKISEIYKANAPADKFSEKKFEEFSKKITKSAAVIAIVLDAHPDLFLNGKKLHRPHVLYRICGLPALFMDWDATGALRV
jgi:nitroreductase